MHTPTQTHTYLYMFNLKKKQQPGSGGRQISEFEASLVYKVSSRAPRVIQTNPVSKNKTNKQTNKQNKTKQKKPQMTTGPKMNL